MAEMVKAPLSDRLSPAATVKESLTTAAEAEGDLNAIEDLEKQMRSGTRIQSMSP